MCFFLQIQFQKKIVESREAEYERLRKERHERIEQILQARKEERESKRKMLFYLSVEEERQKKLKEEEETRKREGTLFDQTLFNLADKCRRQEIGATTLPQLIGEEYFF